MAVRKHMGMPAAAPPLPPPPETIPEPPAVERPAARRTGDQRQGKSQVAGFLPVEAKRQIDIWCATHGKTRQWAMEEAFNLFFAEHHLQRIARAEPDANE